MSMRKDCNSFEGLPLVLRVEDLMPILNIGRNTAYMMVHSGQIQAIRIGRQLRIPKAEILRFLSGPSPS